MVPDKQQELTDKMLRQRLLSLSQTLINIVTLDDVITESFDKKYLQQLFEQYRRVDALEIKRLSQELVVKMSDYLTYLQTILGQQQHSLFLAEQIKYVIPFLLKRIEIAMLNYGGNLQLLSGSGVTNIYVSDVAIKNTKALFQNAIDTVDYYLLLIKRAMKEQIEEQEFFKYYFRSSFVSARQTILINCSKTLAQNFLDVVIGNQVKKITAKEFLEGYRWLIINNKEQWLTQLVEKFPSLKRRQEFHFRVGTQQFLMNQYKCAALLKHANILACLLKAKPETEQINPYNLFVFVIAGGSVDCLKVFQSVFPLSQFSLKQIEYATFLALAKRNLELYEKLNHYLEEHHPSEFNNIYFVEPDIQIIFCLGIYLNRYSAAYLSNQESFLKSELFKPQNIAKTMIAWVNTSEGSLKIKELLFNLLINSAANQNEKFIQHAFEVGAEIAIQYPEVVHNLLIEPQCLAIPLLAKNIVKHFLTMDEKLCVGLLDKLSYTGFWNFKSALVTVYFENAAQEFSTISREDILRLFNMLEGILKQHGISEEVYSKNMRDIRRDFRRGMILGGRNNNNPLPSSSESDSEVDSEVSSSKSDGEESDHSTSTSRYCFE